MPPGGADVRSAMRPGKTTFLAWDHVDGCAVSILGGVTKTCQSRRFTLPPTACQWPQAWLEVCPTTKNSLVFPGQAGQPLSVRGAQTTISKLAENVRLAALWRHSCRRSALTSVHQAGLSMWEVVEISGHRSLAARERYLDQDQHAAREKAEVTLSLLVGGD